LAKNEQSNVRARLIELVVLAYAKLAEHSRMVATFSARALALDIIPALVALPSPAEYKQLETVMQAKLAELDSTRSELNVLETGFLALASEAKLVAQEYEELKSAIRGEMLLNMCEYIDAGTKVFTALDPALSNAVATAKNFLTNISVNLCQACEKFVADRESVNQQLARSLLLAELVAAMDSGCSAQLAKAIAHGIPDIVLPLGREIVTQAVLQGHKHFFLDLAEAKADLNTSYNGSNSYLYLALVEKKIGCSATVAALVAAKADPNGIADSKEQLSMAQLAAREDKLAWMQCLLDNRADLRREATVRTGAARSPLHFACAAERANPDMVTLLLSRGALVNQVDNELNTPLHLCRSRTVALLLTQHGAQLAAKNAKSVRAQDEAIALMAAGGASEDDLREVRSKMGQFERLARQRNSFNVGIVDGDWENKDADVLSCQCCLTKFTTINRRHHCRLCGLVSCGTCAPKRATGQDKGCTVQVRLCDGCFNREILKKANEPV
jgi:hypothetical protein